MSPTTPPRQVFLYFAAIASFVTIGLAWIWVKPYAAAALFSLLTALYLSAEVIDDLLTGMRLNDAEVAVEQEIITTTIGAKSAADLDMLLIGFLMATGASLFMAFIEFYDRKLFVDKLQADTELGKLKAGFEPVML